jgi:hypothetical protein
MGNRCSQKIYTYQNLGTDNVGSDREGTNPNVDDLGIMKGLSDVVQEILLFKGELRHLE